MTERERYAPGPAGGARVEKNRGESGSNEEKWSLILVRELRHSPERVWQALTDPAQLQEWAPFVIDGSLNTTETVKLTWVGAPTAIEIKVTRAEAPKVLEYGDMRWELEPYADGTRLTLWTNIGRRFISMGAAGWHISLDVLNHLLSGTPIGRMAGSEMMKFPGWQRLNAEYAKLFGFKTPKG